jgi:hypothetical protein
MNTPLAVVLALVLPGCWSWTAARSSHAVLGPDLSSAELAASPPDASEKLLQLFSSRGYALIEQRPSQGGLELQFKGLREYHRKTQFGSVFAVLISPAAEGRSNVSIQGVPTLDGILACTPDPIEPCKSTRIFLNDFSSVDGRAEAEVVHGVFSELALEHLVVGPGVDSPRFAQLRPSAIERCREERRQALIEAMHVEDSLERFKQLHQAPTCD